MGNNQTYPSAALRVPRAARGMPTGWEVGKSEERKDGGRDNILRVIRCPRDLDPSTFVAKQGEEATGHRRLFAAAKRHGRSIRLHPAIVQPVWVRHDMVMLPRFESDLVHAVTRGTVTTHEVLSVGRDMVNGIAALASCGLLHTDISPQNVCLRRETNGALQGVLIDFESMLYVPPGTQHTWGGGWVPKLHFSSLMRHERCRRHDDNVDVADELESCGWVMCWALCTLVGVEFLDVPPLPADEDTLLGEMIERARKLGLPCAIHESEHVAETLKRKAYRVFLTGQCPFDIPHDVGMAMSRYFAAVRALPRRWRVTRQQLNKLVDDSRPHPYALRASEVDGLLASLHVPASMLSTVNTS